MDPIWSTFQHYQGLLSNLMPDNSAAVAGALTLAMAARQQDQLKLVKGDLKPGQQVGAWGEEGANVSGEALVPISLMVTVSKLGLGEKLTVRPTLKSQAGTAYGPSLSIGANGTQQFPLDANDQQPTTDLSFSVSSSADKSTADIKAEVVAWEIGT
jgi:hypothetical protein